MLRADESFLLQEVPKTSNIYLTWRLKIYGNTIIVRHIHCSWYLYYDLVAVIWLIKKGKMILLRNA